MSTATSEARPDYRGLKSGSTASSDWWSGARDARLRKMLTDGVPSREIAARLGCSQGSVARRRKRLGLPLSPLIKLSGCAVPVALRAPGRYGRNIGPEPEALTEQKIAARATTLAAPPSLDRLLAETATAPAVVLEQAAPVPRVGDNAACRWPMWGARPADRSNPEYCCQPRARAFVCNGRLVHTPYCDAHSRLAYPSFGKSRAQTEER